MEPVLALQQAVPLMDSWKSSRPPGWPPPNADCTLHHAHWLPSHPRSHYSRTLDRHERSIFSSSSNLDYYYSTVLGIQSLQPQLLRTCSSCPCALCPALPCLALPCPASYFNALWLDRWYLLAYLPTSLLTYFPTYLLTFLPGTRPSLTLAQPSPTLTTTTPLPICIATARENFISCFPAHLSCFSRSTRPSSPTSNSSAAAQEEAGFIY
jgi:hypothetical protein